MTNPTRRDRIAGIAAGAVVFLTAFAAGATPPPKLSVADWAERVRVVSQESGSPYPGRWSHEQGPLLVEIMECLSFDHPSRNVVLKKSHQIGGSEVGLNLFGYVVDHQPAPMMIVLPTLDEASKYNRLKLQPTIDATRQLRSRVRESKSRSSEGSTGSQKRFPGGYCQITGANSSSGLQMISVRVAIYEEISEWPSEAGDRGDPLAQAEKRTTAYSAIGYKRFYVSTPGIKGMCRISARYERSDQREAYLPCPHCGDFIVLRFDNLRSTSDEWPFQAVYSCQACGADIPHHKKREMLARGKWVPMFEGEGYPKAEVLSAADVERYRARPRHGRDPGFHLNQLYSLMVGWDDTLRDWREAEGNTLFEKTFCQQTLGLEWDAGGEAPDHEKLLLRREPYALGILPPGALVLTAMTDVQHDRLEWGVYGWGIGMTGWLIDKGVIEGDPNREEVWAALSEVRKRQYEDYKGDLWPIEAFGVDSGYNSHAVYEFSRRHGNSDGGVFALKGSGDPAAPLIGKGNVVDVNWRGKVKKKGAKVWISGTFQLKSLIYSKLRRTIEGPNQDGVWPLDALRFPEACDEEFFKQLTAEYLVTVNKHGFDILQWHKQKGQANEQLDIAVGALAMADKLGLTRYTPARWGEVAEMRGAKKDEVQRDLASLWSALTPSKDEGSAQTGVVQKSEIDKSAMRVRALKRMARRRRMHTRT